MRTALRRIDLVAVDDRALEAGGILEPKVIPTLDAIHGATAMAIGEDFDVILTYDRRMTEGADCSGSGRDTHLAADPDQSRLSSMKPIAAHRNRIRPGPSNQ
jgi:hypothetical protein